MPADTVIILPPDTPVADILDAAADAMAARGKCDGDFTDGDGRVCAFGAMRLVLFGDASGDAEQLARQPKRWDAYMAAKTAMHQHLRAVYGDGYDAPAVDEWSDASTQDHVVAGLRAAAERARTAHR